MSEEIKSSAAELTDEETGESAGGRHLEQDFLLKQCGNCHEKYDYDLNACPKCRCTTGLVVTSIGTVISSFPEYNIHGGPR